MEKILMALALAACMAMLSGCGDDTDPAEESQDAAEFRQVTADPGAAGEAAEFMRFLEDAMNIPAEAIAWSEADRTVTVSAQAPDGSPLEVVFNVSGPNAGTVLVNEASRDLAPEAAREDEDGETADDGETAYLDGHPFFELFREPAVMLQLRPVAPGEELVVLHTSMGDITLRLFPEEAPLSVENFVTHARNGYFDGLLFHRVIDEFMIQTGDPLGTGMGGESIWGEPFFVKPLTFLFDETGALHSAYLLDERMHEMPSVNLRHFRGALAMAHGGGSMGSQFYIVQSPSVDPDVFLSLMGILDEEVGRFEDGTVVYEGHIFPFEELEHFLSHGGAPFLDWWWELFFDTGWEVRFSHIVFGHVVDGMDVVDAIAAVETNPSDRPLEDVIVERVSFVTAEG